MNAETLASQPTFALTFDTELLWGFFDLMSAAKYERQYPDERRTLASVLRLLDDFDIPATWAVVGHLFLHDCRRDSDGLAHRGLDGPPAAGRPSGWYSADPCTSRLLDPLWYGDDIVDAILSARASHEIGCHSFGHIPYGHPMLTRDAIDADLAACVEAAASRSLVLRSFVFPRNWEGHHEELQAHGFSAYRGAGRVWWSRLPRPVRRAVHVCDHALGIAPDAPRPAEKLPGLWNIPASALLVPHDDVWRAVPAAPRLAKIRAGLRRVQITGGVFHLWTHPCDFAGDAPFMLSVLEAVLREVADARDRGEVAVETMGEISDRMRRAQLLPGGVEATGAAAAVEEMARTDR